MNNRFIPAIIKEKMNDFARWFKGSFFLLVSVILFLSILTFDINDNSFLTTTSKSSSNILGNIGSYLASFLIYSFGIMSLFLMLSMPSEIFLQRSKIKTLFIGRPLLALLLGKRL